MRVVGPLTMSVSCADTLVEGTAYVKSSEGAMTPTTVTPYLLRIALCSRVNPIASLGGRILTMAKPSSNSM